MENIMKTFRLFALIALVSVACFGQTVLVSTTLSSAVALTQNTVTLASGTGVTIPGNANQINTVLWIDHELMRVTGLVSGTTYNVQRGASQTRPHAHLSGATVLLGPPTGNFLLTDYFAEASGSCVAVSESLPRVYIKTGHRFSCVGVAGTQQWMLTSAPDLPVLGSTVASATTIAVTGTIFHVSGTTAVVTVTLPDVGFQPGNSIYMIPDAVFTWTAAGNVSLAGSAVVNKLLIFTWSGSKWIPSYIA